MIAAAAKIMTVTAAMFSLVGIRKRHVVPESQFDFDDQDLAVVGNVDGIGNLATFSIPETQMEHRSVNHILWK